MGAARGAQFPPRSEPTTAVGSSPMAHPKVVVTGIGSVNPLGNDAASSWSAVVAGKSGAGPVTAFDPSPYATTFACEAKDFEPEQWIERRVARRMDRYAQMALAAARIAVDDAQLYIAAEPFLVGVSLLSWICFIRSFQDFFFTFFYCCSFLLIFFFFFFFLFFLGGGGLSIELGARG